MNNQKIESNGRTEPIQHGRRQQRHIKRPINAVGRLKNDFMMIMKDPIPYIKVSPLPSDILECHYVIRGPENTVYQGGIYHGKLRFPVEYPFKPPSIYMITPSGRFLTNTRLCLSFSDFHPGSWNPTWSLSTILTGLLSFMLEEHHAIGSIQASDLQRKMYAKKSLQFNLKNGTFVELFPEIANEIKEKLERTKKLKDKAEKESKERSEQPASPNVQRYERFNSFFWSCIYNLLVVIILILLVYFFRWILTNDFLNNT